MSAVAPAPVPVVATELAGALSFLGPWGALAALALQFGIPFVTKLIANGAKGTDPTAVEWDELVNVISIPGETLIPQRPAAV
jgi:hypothetical protein